MKVTIKRLTDTAKLPTQGTSHAAGFDLYADEEVRIAPHSWMPIKTGLSMALPAHVVGLICPRSGMALTNGVTVLNAPGVVDSDYRGEVKVLLINHDQVGKLIKVGDRVAQMVFQVHGVPEFEEVTNLTDTVRGECGFGSTGK